MKIEVSSFFGRKIELISINFINTNSLNLTFRYFQIEIVYKSYKVKT